MFKTIEIEINGSIVKNLAASKIGKLNALIERKLESIEQLDKYKTLSDQSIENLKSIYQEEIKIITNSIAFLEAIKKYLTDSKKYHLSLREINFLDNNNEIDYKNE